MIELFIVGLVIYWLFNLMGGLVFFGLLFIMLVIGMIMSSIPQSEAEKAKLLESFKEK